MLFLRCPSHHNRHLGSSTWRITMDPHPTVVRTVGTGHKRRARGHRLGCCNSRCNSRPWTQHMQSDKQPNKVDRWRHKVWFFPRGWYVQNPISLIREDWWNMCAIVPFFLVGKLAESWFISSWNLIEAKPTVCGRSWFGSWFLLRESCPDPWPLEHFLSADGEGKNLHTCQSRVNLVLVG